MQDETLDPRQESGVHRLAALLRKEATEVVDPDRNQVAWQRLLYLAHEDDERRLRGPRIRRWWIIAPAAVGLAVLAGLYHLLSGAPRLQFQVDGRVPADAYVISEAGRPKQIDFSDGSNLVLHAGSRLRVAATDRHGAVLSLERGELDLAIHHRPSARWRLDVGPYFVQVRGTHFNVRWNPDLGDVEVDLLDGAVTIGGPGIVAPVALEVGQQFRANKSGSYTVQRQQQSITPSPTEPKEPVMNEPAAASPRGRRVATASPAEPGAAASKPEKLGCDWLGLVSNGQFEATLAQARVLGIGAALTDCPPRSLFALADASRYLGNFELSRKTLIAIRKRSPNDASKAAFFLGRLEEARGNSEAALGWYSHAMQGGEPQFVAEAKAGKARLLRRHSLLPSPEAAP
jgi:ferric-dicitrate binding protein FerR (iron transport regulator)